MESIGFIGTGVMGAAMAKNILAKGYKVKVFNRTESKAAALVAAGAEWLPSVKAVAAASAAVITMVSFPKDVEQVYLGPDGIIANAKPGTFVVDMTTSDPQLAKKIAAAARAQKLRPLDAPVSGGDVGAAKGALSIMVGGTKDDFAAFLPVFEAMGKKIVLLGPDGSGQQCKMANQIAIAANIMGVCESLSYALKAGLDPEQVLDVLSSGGAASWQLSAYAPRIFANDMKPGFYVKHFIKDLRIAVKEARAMGIELPALELAQSLYAKLAQEGDENLGTQALFNLYRENNAK